ncbi:aminoimidazole riboside kinase [Dickeya sp. CFBP 2040]|uniref:Aminoimidazole riboside kinase n=1 Tax=Dickeya poaceiphila TaxID=568768 RepID=A0A5B8IBD0_9GAMM|nr:MULTISPECIES: aminoimidazole riboside kinase [Dickeya]NKI76097.1 aminoimidazole riboside kinase [Dickeya sp. CFBP 2040]QDX31574.1 aminoimidazole riboside kinase [Dickeya poaceiphila]
MSHKVWVMGDAVVDLIPEGEERYLKCPGGAPANVAVGVARLGGCSGFIGRVGEDTFGHFLRDVLAREQVDIRHMQPDAEHRTSTVVVSLDAQGERTFTFMVRPSADLFLQPSDLPEFQCSEWLHLCSIALSHEPSRSTALEAIRRIRSAQGWVSFDPNIRTDLWHSEQALKDNLEQVLALADVVKLSEEEFRFLSGSDDIRQGSASLMSRYPIKRLLMTQGGNGVWLHDGQQLQHFPAPRVTPVDTTGAGDAFVAGMLAALADYDSPHQVDDWQAVLTQAQRCGALATTAKGAMTALPFAHQLTAAP